MKFKIDTFFDALRRRLKMLVFKVGYPRFGPVKHKHALKIFKCNQVFSYLLVLSKIPNFTHTV